MPAFKSYDQMLLENIQNQTLFISQILLNIESHRMGLISDEVYIKCLTDMQELNKQITDIAIKSMKGEIGTDEY